jgi:hypothetical protein
LQESTPWTGEICEEGSEDKDLSAAAPSLDKGSVSDQELVNCLGPTAVSGTCMCGERERPSSGVPSPDSCLTDTLPFGEMPSCMYMSLFLSGKYIIAVFNCAL